MYYTTFVAGEYDFLDIRPGDAVLDAGANVGDFTVRAARLVGAKGRVVAIEANPASLALLRSNIATNALENVVVIERFISDSESMATVHDKGSYTVSSASEGGTDRRVIAADIDTVLATAGISHVDVAKIDIEGMEVAAIKKQQYVDDLRELAVETHSSELQSSVTSLLSARGFDLREINAWELYRNTLLNSFAHPISVFRSELMTRGFGAKAVIMWAKGPNPLLLVSENSSIRLFHARRRARAKSQYLDSNSQKI